LLERETVRAGVVRLLRRVPVVLAHARDLIIGGTGHQVDLGPLVPTTEHLATDSF